MAQPKWKEIQSADYFRILKDETGEYVEEVEVVEEVGDEKFLLFRFPLDRLKFVRGYLVPEAYKKSWPHALPEYVEWFSKDLDKVAQSVGAKVEDLEKALCSADPKRRFSAYEAIAGYHGLENFDSYPIELTEDELDERWS